MELMFEARTNLRGFDGKLRFIQCRPQVHPEPLLGPDGEGDGKGVSLYGSVLPDGGKLRMWYYAVPRSVEGVQDGDTVAYAESDNGIDWHKPDLRVPGHVANLTNLGMHSATVFIDPDSPASHRYRATGRTKRKGHGMCHHVKQDGYFTAHSADGWNWELDSDEPRWKAGDVITSIYHPGRRSGLVAMKYGPRWMRMKRRCIHTAVFQNGAYSDDVSALYPDEFDDQCAAMRGFHSCDYYGMGMLPAGRATVGFVWKFWHELPYTNSEGSSGRGLYGTSDVGLVYQSDPGGRWMHLPGRPVFIDRESLPWTRGWINTAANVVEVGDDHRLYFSGRVNPHGHGLDERWMPKADADTTFK
ncbi:MAG: hypothetical protein LC725_07910, partial [Lentisphaerae bacterium]|nr:hypothetical protein [Lentisphaerota bacterium]